ncbi:MULTISPECIES: pyruvate carboxylase subunit B [unclassified Lentimonas]|uniref:pyruvate carboxylase subunit B n=1 Tax=unclassified Lentimonas TaxID=2630993 RepID=UPI001323E455|nr:MULTISPECIES: pyruvate carboxylase subunit B [unclassified Lentimonas]CAA6677933.1 Oxaloacetate decarboxylase alpha chain (EC [Lentimonas sp. CC4]CAA6684037.1 Oxaloacetate decarboxylase alpha chain (EC [Lentimonas sp. CC6]CAA6689851.1 Oxaloacetate decarboxylase alpha chain (EC [Lentimonas sp. CC10]CAA6697198.1 Oxaloacetate decarboxylase alpha chain (EC [Lentimonas sp. CC19]CAA7069451.1 Oxaloacetate decarboxylase alpha chain (EC [Lentimonas sp. CC11]
MKSVQLNNNVLRDGHQSLAATRMRTEQMLPVCEQLDNWGFGALETWGGATIDSGLRFLDEFPFDRLDALKKACPKTPHMMLLRGQNIVQYAHFPDDVVTAFIKTSAQHGMNIFRIFDALNDTRNMKCAIDACRAAGAQAHGTICFTSSPVHSAKKFIEMGLELQKMGCHAIVLKDMAGLIAPIETFEIIDGLKKTLKIPVWIHTHDTAGLGASTYMSAIDAGVDAIDLSVSPFANGTGQPDTTRMLAMLKGHARCPDVSEAQHKALKDIRSYLEGPYKELSAFTSHTNEIIDTDTLEYQVPGGMLSNFRTQLKEQKMEDKFEDVFREIPVVREALGWIPLVTPTSQIVGMQAFLNVKFGRWNKISPQAADIALGYYGRTPAKVSTELQELASKQSDREPITCRPVESPKAVHKHMDDLRKELQDKNMPSDDEHCVIYAMFPQQLETHFKNKDKPAKVDVPAAAAKAAATPAAAAPTSGGPVKRYALNVNGKRIEVGVEEIV